MHSRATENRATNSRCVCVFGARIAGRSYHHGGVRSPERCSVGGGQGRVRCVRSLGSGARQAEGGCRCQQQHGAEPEERARRALPTRKTDAKRAAQRLRKRRKGNQRAAQTVNAPQRRSAAATAAAAPRLRRQNAHLGAAWSRVRRANARHGDASAAASGRAHAACVHAVPAPLQCAWRVAGAHAPARPRVLHAPLPPPATRRSSRPRAQAQPCRCVAAGYASLAASKLAQTHTQARECAKVATAQALRTLSPQAARSQPMRRSLVQRAAARCH